MTSQEKGEIADIKKKPKKVPIDCRTGRKWDVTDSSSWATFDEAVARLEAENDINGIGFCFLMVMI